MEPKDKADFSKSIAEFHAKIDSSSLGAVFLAVCRGKASEGIDFSNNKARAVLIVGIPFPSFKDPKIILKRQFLDDQLKEARSRHIDVHPMSGDMWYNQTAARAVNQAIGRVIRHRNDWGAILLCDERFSAKSQQEQLPRWIRPHVQTFPQFGQCQVCCRLASNET